MAKTKTNEIIIGQNTQLSVQQAFQNMIDIRREQGMAVHFSNRQAIETVCKAIQIELDPNITKEQKQAAALFATEIAVNSDTAGEEVKRTIEAMQADIMGG